MKKLCILLLAVLLLSTVSAQAEAVLSSTMTNEVRQWLDSEYQRWFGVNIPSDAAFRALPFNANNPENPSNLYALEYVEGTTKTNLLVSLGAKEKVLCAHVSLNGESESASTKELSQYDLWQRFSTKEAQMLHDLQLPDETKIVWSSPLLIQPLFYLDMENLANSEGAFVSMHLLSGAQDSNQMVTLIWGPKEDQLRQVILRNVE